MHRSLFFAAASLSLLVARSADAQLDAPRRFSVEPFVGAYADESTAFQEGAAARPEPTRDYRPGVIAGVNLGYATGSRTRLSATLARAEVDDFGKFGSEPGNYFVYGRNTWLATAGAEYDLVQGPTRLAVGLHAGVAADREVREETVGTPSPAVREQYDQALSGGYGALHPVVAPGVSLTLPVFRNLGVTLGARDFVFVGDERWTHRPAGTLTLRLRLP
jgi:hypothetical protein